ncbi:MAG TPA: hypothetical protein VEA15_08230 [Caulobacteraceae bacterium]|nr:hypothetical protein [Caulobacteraceae bacterium]
MPIQDWFGSRPRPTAGDALSVDLFEGLPHGTERRAVAVRTALRGFAGIDRIDNAPWDLSEKLGLPIRLQAIRAVFVAWCELLYDDVRPGAAAEAFGALRPLLSELDQALPHFYGRNVMGSDYAVASWQDSVEAGRRAARLVEAIETLAPEPLPFDADRRYADLLDNLVLYGPDGHDNQRAWRAAQRAAIAADCEALRRGRPARELALAPLWPEAAAAALETNLAATDWRAFDHYLKIWLRERKDGALVMGKEPAASAERMVRTAGLPAEFWSGRPATDTLYAFDYALHGRLDNPSWGSPTMKRLRP